MAKQKQMVEIPARVKQVCRMSKILQSINLHYSEDCLDWRKQILKNKKITITDLNKLRIMLLKYYTLCTTNYSKRQILMRIVDKDIEWLMLGGFEGFMWAAREMQNVIDQGWKERDC